MSTLAALVTDSVSYCSILSAPATAELEPLANGQVSQTDEVTMMALSWLMCLPFSLGPLPTPFCQKETFLPPDPGSVRLTESLPSEFLIVVRAEEGGYDMAGGREGEEDKIGIRVPHSRFSTSEQPWSRISYLSCLAGFWSFSKPVSPDSQ